MESYKAFAKIKEHMEIETIKALTPEQINEALNNLHAEIENLEKIVNEFIEWIDCEIVRKDFHKGFPMCLDQFHVFRWNFQKSLGPTNAGNPNGIPKHSVSSFLCQFVKKAFIGFQISDNRFPGCNDLIEILIISNGVSIQSNPYRQCQADELLSRHFLPP